MLTNSELKQIKDYLALYGKKDSQLSPAVLPLNVDDKVVILQGDANKLVTISELAQTLEGEVTYDICTMTDYENLSKKVLGKLYICTYDDTHVLPSGVTGNTKDYVKQIYLDNKAFLHEDTKFIYDEEQKKYQKEINQEVQNTLNSLSENKADKSDTYTKEEVNTNINNAVAPKANSDDVYTKNDTYSKTELDNLITTPNQQYVSVETYEELPATGEADTIYRVGGTTSYSEYAWDGNDYIQLSEKNTGIDDEPTTGSDNLVKSGGIKTALDKVSHSIETNFSEHRILPIINGDGQNVFNGYVNPNGTVNTTSTAVKRFVVDVSGYSRVRFLGFKYTSPVYCAFYDSENMLIGTTIPCGTAETVKTEEIMLEIPTNAKYFQTRYVENQPSKFYCYLEKGLTVEEQLEHKVNTVSKRKRYKYWKGKRISNLGDTFSVEDTPGWNIALLKVPPTETSKTLVIRFGYYNEISSSDPLGSTGLVITTVPYPLLPSSSAYYDFKDYTDERTITIAASDVTRYYWISYYDYYKGNKNTTPFTLDGEDITVEMLEGECEENRWVDFPAGTFINSDISTANVDLNNNPNYNSVRVAEQCKLVSPEVSTKFRVHLDDNTRFMFCNVFATNSIGNRVHTYQIPLNGFKDFVEFDADDKAIRLSFLEPVRIFQSGSPTYYCKELSSQEINSLLASGKLRIQYQVGINNSVAERNSDKENRVVAASQRRRLNFPLVGHISDLHGDVVRFKNFIQYLSEKSIVPALSTGDASMYKHGDGTTYQDVVANDYPNVDLLYCIGNHESSLIGGSGTGSTVPTLFEDNISNLASNYQYLSSIGTITTKCYYYKDYDEQQLRVIALNQYEDGVYGMRLSQSQMEWFVSTLLSTPEGFGVIVLLHSPERKVIVDSQYDKFRQPVPNTGESYQPYGCYVKKKPIATIVDAFISKASGSVTFYDHDASYTGTSNVSFSTEPTTVSYDFTSVASDVEFIAYCCGHRHEDWIGYYEKEDSDSTVDNRGETLTNNQLVLLPTCGNGMYGDSSNPAWANQSDLPRGHGNEVSQDAFNIYGIDRINKVVKVVRIGATVTENMDVRDMMVIPYI